MKQIRITLTEQILIDLQNMIGEIPTKWGNPLVNILIPNAQETSIGGIAGTLEESDPIGGGGGGGAPKPKPTQE